MKKIIAMFLVLVCAFSLTACTDTEPEARVAVEGFLTALTNGDYENLVKYVDDASVIPEDLNYGKIVEDAMASMPAGTGYDEEFRSIFENFVNKIKSVSSYTINSVEATGDGYAYTVSLTLPNVDLGAAAEEKLSEEALMEVVTRLYTEGKITDETPEEEVANILMPELIKMIKDAYESIEFTTETTDKVIVVSDASGEWLVDTAKTFVE